MIESINMNEIIFKTVNTPQFKTRNTPFVYVEHSIVQNKEFECNLCQIRYIGQMKNNAPFVTISLES